MPKLRESAPKLSTSEALTVKEAGGSTEVTDMARAHRFDRGLGAEQRHRMDRLET